LFGLIFIKKNNQIEFFLKPKQVQTDRFWFGFLGQKPVQTGLARFFRFCSVFFILARFFRFDSIFFRFRLSLVQLFFSGFLSFSIFLPIPSNHARQTHACFATLEPDLSLNSLN
jgi:hypothetical protein